MCSIFGQINFLDPLCDSKKFINVSDTLRHRGPDSRNYLSDEVNYQFAFNRLAIMDLNRTGNQPMYSQCKRYVCIFNGEIYNHQKIFEEIKDLFKWEGSSDTEVLINAWSLWGEKTLDKIDGMFAFAVWDTKNKDVILARDRIGEKPLYYYTENGSLIFSSRPNPILEIYPKLKKDFDLENLNYYFEAGYFLRKKSYIKNIFKLEPGNFIKFNKDGLLIKKYWSINDYNPKKVNSYTLDYHTDKCEDLLKESISERIISDKPLGFLLSGGIDSSLVVSMASKIMDKKNIKAFSLGFYNKQYDESIDASLVAKKLDINLDIKKITYKEVLKLLPDFYQKFDEPFAFLEFCQNTSLVWLTIAAFHHAREGELGRFVHPVWLFTQHLLCIHGRVVFALSYYKSILFKIFVNNIPGCIPSILHSTYTEPLSLSEGMKHEPVMLPKLETFNRLDKPWFGRKIFLQKIFETTFTDETDSC